VTAQAGFDWIFAHVGGGAVALSPQINHVSKQFFSPFNDVNAVGSAQENSELSQAAFTKVDASLTGRASIGWFAHGATTFSTRQSMAMASI